MLDTIGIATVDTIRHRDVPVVVVTGEVDSTTVDPVRVHLFDQLDRCPQGVVLDLSGVVFMGSTALQLLVESAGRAEHAGTSLAVVAQHRAVLMPMRITELDRVVAVHATVDQAVAAVLSR
ncbi:stage II sporulation protein AA (anti-sigma F factor antagonist) [Saccharothrix carnea]|uniref:Anti-sigma factor antagonist n=1 Tax=Saccharothrix carnea TaxID=1280637 RepID=A0A2P8HZC1_SACCR|nr:STAS domain-containing protein [Saccharothrix carnea]PSL51557.1 stage II sporulation protein AA (anti-sigma F factor antagonist) [Saccharothrix carnea]